MYNYEEQKPTLLTDSGQRNFLKVRDGVQKTLKIAGAIRMQEAMQFSGCCSSWEQLACVDRMVELGELREIKQQYCAGQHRIFVDAR